MEKFIKTLSAYLKNYGMEYDSFRKRELITNIAKTLSDCTIGDARKIQDDCNRLTESLDIPENMVTEIVQCLSDSKSVEQCSSCTVDQIAILVEEQIRKYIPEFFEEAAIVAGNSSMIDSKTGSSTQDTTDLSESSDHRAVIDMNAVPLMKERLNELFDKLPHSIKYSTDLRLVLQTMEQLI